MIEPPIAATISHANASCWLDVADKLSKFLAVLVGATWTYINYRRSRTHAHKLDLQLGGSIVVESETYVELSAGLKNLGASRYKVQQKGTGCEVIAITRDLSESTIHLFSVFESLEGIEPGETIGDSLICKVPLPLQNIVWVKLHLRRLPRVRMEQQLFDPS